jgi:tRNA modification GTPase
MTGAKTFVCLLTPAGSGAIAVVRVWGPQAIEIADSVFRPARGARLAETPAGRMRLGRLGAGSGDEVIAVVLDGGEPCVEIHCHGGNAAVELVVGTLQDAGAQCGVAAHSFGIVHGDWLSADAMEDLPFAPTLHTAEILLDQAQGALRREVLELADAVESEPARAALSLEALLQRADVGLRLCRGWRIVIAGRPNVGKSQLFNALAGFARAIVDPTPGTTRDTVSVRTSFGGWPVELVDTAGVRAAEDAIEAEGIARARREQANADLVALVLDRSIAMEQWDRDLIAVTERALLVANKSDLYAAWEPKQAGLGTDRLITVSALFGVGLADLIEAIVGCLVPCPPAPGSGVPFREEHVEHLRVARASLLAGDVPAAKHRLDCLLRSA